MKIYTRTGDAGETSLFGGRRVPKDTLRIESYGTVDELNSLIGVCRSFNTVREVDGILEEVQNDLFALGADLATPAGTSPGSVRRIGNDDVVRIERHIDGIEKTLEPLQNFILPGGSRSAAILHVARAVCRRAERLVVHLTREEHLDGTPLVYLNRLSDLLFTLARRVNALSNTPETAWHP